MKKSRSRFLRIFAGNATEKGNGKCLKSKETAEYIALEIGKLNRALHGEGYQLTTVLLGKGKFALFLDESQLFKSDYTFVEECRQISGTLFYAFVQKQAELALSTRGKERDQ